MFFRFPGRSGPRASHAQLGERIYEYPGGNSGTCWSWCNRSQKLQGRGRILLTCRRPHRVVRERASVSGWRRVTTEAGGAGATHPPRPWRILAAPHHPAATPFCVAIEGDAHSPKAHAWRSNWFKRFAENVFGQVGDIAAAGIAVVAILVMAAFLARMRGRIRRHEDTLARARTA